jgi:hypothetical protein
MTTMEGGNAKGLPGTILVQSKYIYWILAYASKTRKLLNPGVI